MKIAVLSDTRLPTRRDFPAHGLGKMALALAEGLAQRGHAVTLFAGAGSRFEAGPLVTAEREEEFSPEGFDAILDSTHRHGLQNVLQDAAVVNSSVDREAAPGRCAVYPSEAHKAWQRRKYDAAATGRAIPHGVEIPDLPAVEPVLETTRDYFLYLSMFHAPKGPVMAWNAARLAGVRLVMAGPTPPAPPAGVEYVGPMFGDDKLKLMAGARALIFPASTEAGGLTPLEAQSVGTPVICTSYGGAKENVRNIDNLKEWPAGDTLELTQRIRYIAGMNPDRYSANRNVVKRWVEQERSVGKMVGSFEQALVDAANGEVW